MGCEERPVEDEAGDGEEDGNADRQAVGERPPPPGSLGPRELARVEAEDGDRRQCPDPVEGREPRVAGQAAGVVRGSVGQEVWAVIRKTVTRTSRHATMPTMLTSRLSATYSVPSVPPRPPAPVERSRSASAASFP